MRAGLSLLLYWLLHTGRFRNHQVSVGIPSRDDRPLAKRCVRNFFKNEMFGDPKGKRVDRYGGLRILGKGDRQLKSREHQKANGKQGH